MPRQQQTCRQQCPCSAVPSTLTLYHIVCPAQCRWMQIMPAHVIASLHRELTTASSAAAAAQAGQPQQPRARARCSAPASTTATPPADPAGSTASDSAGSGAPLGCTAPGVPEHLVPAVRAALRLVRYSLARCGAVLGLMDRLASVPESFEMARATGLTLDQVWGRSSQLAAAACFVLAFAGIEMQLIQQF